VYQVTGPGQGADAEQTSQVVVQARFSILKPGQAGAELGLQVQPARKQEDCRQNQQEHRTEYRSLLVRMPMVYHQ
jgi:hypothetical protein